MEQCLRTLASFDLLFLVRLSSALVLLALRLLLAATFELKQPFTHCLRNQFQLLLRSHLHFHLPLRNLFHYLTFASFVLTLNFLALSPLPPFTLRLTGPTAQQILVLQEHKLLLDSAQLLLNPAKRQELFSFLPIKSFQLLIQILLKLQTFAHQILYQWERTTSYLFARIDLIIIMNQKMSQKRRASRHSKGEETLSRLKCFEALIGFNPYHFEEEIERIFKQTLKRMLDDFIKTMVQHDLAQEMAGFRVEEHIASAVAFMEQELDKFGQWIENTIVNKEEIRKAKEAIDHQKHVRNEKIKTIMGLVLQLTNSIRNKRVQELEKMLETEVEKYRIHEIKNIYEYDRALSLQEKYQKVYDEHFEKVRQKFEKVCGKYEAKYANR